MFTVYLGLGTNIGDKLQNLKDCLNQISYQIGEITKVSSVYETEPWGVTNQDNYLNIVVELRTHLFPIHILSVIHDIEAFMGRKRSIRWESRLIDIDILIFENFQFSMPNLIIPHPYLSQRNFVVFPLSEIAPNLVHPVFKQTIQSLKEYIKDSGWIKLIENEVL